MVQVDVAVVGGGLQGLVLLRELTSAGYGVVLVTNGELGRGQTLHSHGLLNSGTGLVTGAVERELHEFTVPYLGRLGVTPYGHDHSYLLAPEAMAEQLAPAWEANRYRPEPIDPSRLPAGLETAGLRAHRVHGLSVDKRRLVAALAAGSESLVLRGEVVEADPTIRVRAEPSGELVSLEAGAVVVAAGCGTKGLLRRLFAVDESILGRIAYTKAHMICLRAPEGVLPDIGTVVSPGLLIAAHPPGDAPTPGSRLVTWYVTPADPAPAHFAEAPDDGAAEVDGHVMATGIAALMGLVPQLAHDDARIQATVFAGYKQDVDRQSTRPACEVVDRYRNVVMVLPSVLANAVPNAVEALRLLEGGARRGTSVSPEAPLSTGIAVGQLNEDSAESRWMQ